MNFTRRELTLALSTGLVVLIGLTYWIVSNKLPTIRDGDKERQLIERKIEVNKRLIRKQKPLMARLNSIINTLPQHDKDKDVQYELLQEISQQAGNTQFNIIRRIPGDERKVGNTELYELSIDCTYESTLEPLVYFLYNLQAKGAVMNVSELQVKQASTRPDRKGQLKGSFLVDFAYSRIDYTAEPALVRYHPHRLRLRLRHQHQHQHQRIRLPPHLPIPTPPNRHRLPHLAPESFRYLQPLDMHRTTHLHSHQRKAVRQTPGRHYRPPMRTVQPGPLYLRHRV